MGASARTTWSLMLIVGQFVDDGSGKERHESSYYHSVV